MDPRPDHGKTSYRGSGRLAGRRALIKRFHYETHNQLRSHLADFIGAYNFGQRLKTLKGLTPYEAICKTWTSDPGRFTLNPLHQMPGLNI